MWFISYFLLFFIPVNWSFIKRPHDKFLLTVQEICVSQSRCSRPCCAVLMEWGNVELYSSLSVPLGSILNCTVTCFEISRGEQRGSDGAWESGMELHQGRVRGDRERVCPRGWWAWNSSPGQWTWPLAAGAQGALGQHTASMCRWYRLLQVSSGSPKSSNRSLSQQVIISVAGQNTVTVQSLGGTVCPSSHRRFVFPSLAMIKSYGGSFMWKSHCIHSYIY